MDRNLEDILMSLLDRKKIIKARDLVAGDKYEGKSIVLVRPQGLKT